MVSDTNPSSNERLREILGRALVAPFWGQMEHETLAYLLDDVYVHVNDSGEGIKATTLLDSLIAAIKPDETTDRRGGRYGPYFAILNYGGSLRCNEAGDPYVFAQMGTHDNHTNYNRKIVKVMVEEMPSEEPSEPTAFPIPPQEAYDSSKWRDSEKAARCSVRVQSGDDIYRCTGNKGHPGGCEQWTKESPQKASGRLLHADEDVYTTCNLCERRFNVRHVHVCDGKPVNGSEPTTDR